MQWLWDRSCNIPGEKLVLTNYVKSIWWDTDNVVECKNVECVYKIFLNIHMNVLHRYSNTCANGIKELHKPIHPWLIFETVDGCSSMKPSLFLFRIFRIVYSQNPEPRLLHSKLPPSMVRNVIQCITILMPLTRSKKLLLQSSKVSNSFSVMICQGNLLRK